MDRGRNSTGVIWDRMSALSPHPVPLPGLFPSSVHQRQLSARVVVVFAASLLTSVSWPGQGRVCRHRDMKRRCKETDETSWCCNRRESI